MWCERLAQDGLRRSVLRYNGYGYIVERTSSSVKKDDLGVIKAREAAKPVQWRLKITFWRDVTRLLSVCLLQTCSFTGLVLHEWLGLALVGMVLAHLLLAWSWIATQSRRLFAVKSVRARINYFLNLGLFAGVTAVIFSGILISQQA